MDTAATFMPDGYVGVPMDVFSIGERIMRGDATMGWRGDPRMSLMFNPDPATNRGKPFEVWGVDQFKRPYIVARYESVGPRILADLAASDWQNGTPMLDRMYEAERKKRADKAAKRRDENDEILEKLRWGINKTFGHMTGSTRLFGQVGGGGKKP